MSVSRIHTTISGLWLHRDTVIMFVPLIVHLLIRKSISWATNIPFLSYWVNAPELSPKFIGYIRRLSIVFATVSVHPEKDLDAITGNVENEKSHQKNVRVEMCEVKYLFQLFWIVINWPMKTHYKLKIIIQLILKLQLFVLLTLMI